MAQLFTGVSDLLRVRNAYRDLKKSPAGEVILRDLARTCNAATTTFHEDPHEAARQEGKRQVWLRIQNMMNMTDDEIHKLAHGE